MTEVFTRPERHLRRLETLIDVVFAVVLIEAFLLLPKPELQQTAQFGSLLEFFQENDVYFGVIAISVAMTIIYWMQNNELFGNLNGTDVRHASVAIVQVFLLLIFLYATHLGMEFEGDRFALVLQSLAAALMGFAAWANWVYACKNRRLLSEQIGDDEALALRVKSLAEPLTACFTLPFALLGSTPWTLSWLAYPLVRKLLHRRSRKKR